MIPLFISLVLVYLLGSISPSYLLGKLLRGIDLREHGSGNVGATNAFRVLGKGPGIATLAFDMLKGFLAILPLAPFFETYFHIPLDPVFFRILLGLTVIIGHNWTVFLKFKGGKGVATSCGVFLALAPDAVSIALSVWLVVALLTRRVSLGSLAGALSGPIIMYSLRKPIPLVVFTLLITAIIFYTHRSNIRKIFFEKK